MRATLGATIVVAAALAGGSVFLLAAHRSNLTESVTTSATLRADDLAAALSDGTLPDAIAVAEDDEALVQIVDATTNQVARSSPNIEGESPLTDVAALTVPDTGSAAYTVDDLPIGDTPFRVIARRVASDGRTYLLFVGTSLEPVQEGTRSLGSLLLVGAPLLVLLVGATTWVVVGRALRPVERIRAEVSEISEHDLDRRVPEPSADDEIGRLARTMNAMLERLAASTRRQRRFVEDASHELRSPLTAIRAQLEVDIAHPGGADWETTRGDVLDETMRLQRLVEDLLALAQTDNHEGGRHELVDLDDVVLGEAHRVRARGKVTVDARRVSGGQVLGDRDALTRALRNLLDNAERHARSHVSVAVAEDGSDVTVEVADDGPGVPEELRDRIFERFTRADEARSRDAGGSGLGLAIAREIVVAHGGTLELAPANPGARFVARLPRAH